MSWPRTKHEWIMFILGAVFIVSWILINPGPDPDDEVAQMEYASGRYGR